MLCFRCGSYNPENAQKCSVCGQGFIDESGRVVGPPRRESKVAQPASIFVPGEVVAGRYRIGELLGQGGVGAVYRARDLEIDVDIALKAITPNLLQTEEEQKNFSKQIKGARKLQHPNIVRIYDEGHEGNRRFFTMKLLEGLTLRKIIRLRHEKGQPFSAEELVPIFHQLAAALDYAHKSTWHGDLKPENILILPDLLKVTDFNLVKGLPLKPFLGIAKSRSKGFPYIAPELRVEAQNIDGRVDIYAVGVILAEMLTGLVFEGHYTRAMTAALEQLPTKLDGLVRKALTEHPDGRYQRAGDLARDLDAALGAMTTPLPPPARPAQPQLGGGLIAQGTPPRVTAQPPPPPEETGPSLSAAPAPALSSESGPGMPPPMLDDEAREPSELVEIGQSQVLLLESGITRGPGMLAEAARRLMAAGSTPEDTVDETVTGLDPNGSDVDTSPRSAPLPKEIVVARPGRTSSGERGHDADRLVEALYSEEADEGLIPPPLPGDENDPLDKSLDRPIRLPGDDDDDGLSGDDDEPTGERGVRPTGGGAQAAHAGDNGTASEIHDALTALKPHPPELMDDDVRAEHEEAIAAAAEAAAEKAAAQREEAEKAERSRHKTATGATAGERTDKLDREKKTRTAQPQPPPIDADDDDSLKETLSADVLQAAKERSSPSIHRAEALPPPVVAPPPVLRPVSPPKRSGQGSAPLAAALIVAVVVVAVLVVVWRFVLVDKAAGPSDGVDPAVVRTGAPDAPGPDGPGTDGPAVAAAPVDAGPGFVAGAGKTDGKGATDPTDPIDPAQADGPVVAKLDPVTPPPVDAKTDPPPGHPSNDPPKGPPKTESPGDARPPDSSAAEKTGPKPDDTKVALASGTCPRGMILVEGGSFTFGSAAGDPMRNFGEADAATVEMKPFCIEYYEQPNGKDEIPTTGVSWQAAKNACERSGRRLCSEKEWERACKGPGSTRFPYGNTYDAETCNTEDADGKPRALAPATSFKRCRSPFKVFMMAGNAEEWVLDPVGGQKIAKGGAADRPDFASRCAARRTLSPRTTSATLGFRCCADPE